MSGADPIKGFSMIELVMVIAIGILLLGLVAPMGISMYRGSVVDGVVDDALSLLRTAQEEAKSRRNDIAHGIYFGTSSLVHFQGGSYVTRVPSADQVVYIPNGTTFTGIPAEVLFLRGLGTPSATGTITVSLYGHTKAILLSDIGMITRAL